MQYEVIGIIATLFVLASFIVNDIKKVRLINIVGALLFVIYGYLINAFSTLLLNGLLILIHVYYLRKEFKKK
jgi:hypothetical protein